MTQLETKLNTQWINFYNWWWRSCIKSALELATSLHITRIHTTIEGDTFFPNFDTQCLVTC